MLKLLTRILGDPSERVVKKLQTSVEEINALEPEMQALGDAELRAKTDEFRQRLAEGETLDDLLPEAFAVAREAARRTIGLRPYDVQLMGGMVLHEGNIGEMKTGEGKTLVATLPLYLNALLGRGAHLVTVNDYLAKRDAQWMGPVYHALGLSVGVIQHEAAFRYDPTFPASDDRYRHLRPIARKEAYAADITYGTNNEFGFDYLRDNMVHDLADRVQGDLYYAIVDEVDNILIDEARTPLIISGQAEESTDLYRQMARLVPRIRRDVDFTLDEKHRAVMLTEEGIERIEQLLNVDNLYDPANYVLTHYLENALKAQFTFHRDQHYVLVRDGKVVDGHDPEAEIVIVDEFTGRLMFGRRYSEGLHQAIEAKESVRIRQEMRTLATITFQNYFRMYDKLAGMTGTAKTEEEEFQKIYGLDVIVIPTHRPMIRQDAGDLVFKDEKSKFRAVVEEIAELVQLGRPVLVGTVSIENSEKLSAMLERRGVAHQVLNAKHHEREARIIAQAGRPGTVTIATNMAGRGVDILLGGNPDGLAEDMLHKKGLMLDAAPPEVLEAARAEARAQCAADRERVVALGGLHILGTERHEARRIDNQLRGRSGRQGDPGSSRFYVALDDELMRRFGGPNIARLMERFGLEDDVPIEHTLVSKAIENAQTKVEAYNFDVRKHVVEYDDVMNKHREVFYAERMKILREENLRPHIEGMLDREIAETVASLFAAPEDERDYEQLLMALRGMVPADIDPDSLAGLSKEQLTAALQAEMRRLYDQKEADAGADLMRRIERWILLQVMDRHWVDHLTGMEEIREGVGLRAYGQRDPLVEYKREAHIAFETLLGNLQRDVAQMVLQFSIQRQPEPPQPVARAVRTNREADDGGGRQPVRVAAGKVGRNDPCPCGSGKKYKKCHGR